jgi:hypothetical protein
MPALAALRSTGRYMQRDARVAGSVLGVWTAFMTGKTPRRNGIFGLVDLEAG